MLTEAAAGARVGAHTYRFLDDAGNHRVGKIQVLRPLRHFHRGNLSINSWKAIVQAHFSFPRWQCYILPRASET